MSHDARKSRGLTQKLFLIETLAIADDGERKYAIMGSTGNVYTVTISSIPNCTCPDHQVRHKRCKHIYFVLLRIMKQTNVDKGEYTKDDLEKMFNSIPEITKILCVDNDVKEKYNKNKDKEINTKVNKKGLDDVCPICLDELTNGEELDFCKFSCGKSVHMMCFDMWNKKNGPKCVFCSHDWTNESKKYLNLSKSK